jgi:hypothetical protein
LLCFSVFAIVADMGYGKSTRRQLDALVVNVELTLVSIIQGVALSFLAQSSRTPVGDLRFDQWPYVANGLMLILMFWSRSVVHALTLLRWPLEFVHNFLYIACTLVEAITFTDLTDPLRWYAFNAVFAILAWLIFVVDLRRMMHQRQSEATGPAEEELYGVIIRDYYMNIVLLMPAMALLNLTAIGGIYFWPEAVIRGGSHVVFATMQTIAFLGYLIYVIRLFATMAPMIQRTNQEEAAGLEGA